MVVQIIWISLHVISSLIMVGIFLITSWDTQKYLKDPKNIHNTKVRFTKLSNTRKKRISMVLTLIGTFVDIGLLYCGGFFDNML